MKKILVPVDFSASTRNSAEYAASLAKAFNAELCLLHIYNEPVPAIEGGSAAMMLSAELKEEYEGRLNDEKNYLEKKYDRKVHSRMLAGFKSDAIKEMAETWNADLVVMGRIATKQKMVFGSTIIKTLRKTNTPVLVIPENIAYAPPKRIVLAIDFEETVFHNTLDILADFAAEFQSALSVLHIEKTEAPMPAGEIESKLQWGRAMSKLSYTYEQVENDSVEKGILNFVGNHPTDMLVMVAHHHNILQRLFGNTHTGMITFDVNLPLLVVKN